MAVSFEKLPRPIISPDLRDTRHSPQSYSHNIGRFSIKKSLKDKVMLLASLLQMRQYQHQTLLTFFSLYRTHKDRTLFVFRISQKPNIFLTNLRFHWKCWKLNWFDIDTGHSIMTNNLWHNSIYTDGINSNRSDKHTNTDQMEPIFIECNSYSRFFFFFSLFRSSRTNKWLTVIFFWEINRQHIYQHT